ncbi:MAG: hypothetical protein ACFBRM_08645 [Pikeienuella sp.]
MSDLARFEGLKKLSEEPFFGQLAKLEVELQTPVDLPPTAPAARLLAEISAQSDGSGLAEVDMIRVLALVLPKREAVWWSCLAGRDLVGHETELTEGPLAAAEAWVFKPCDERRAAAFEAAGAAKPTDDTALAAMAAVYSTGTMGPGDLDAMETPAGMFSNAVFGMVMTSLEAAPEDADLPWLTMLVERGLDIARGGNGRSVELLLPEPVEEDDGLDDEDDEDDEEGSAAQKPA